MVFSAGSVGGVEPSTVWAGPLTPRPCTGGGHLPAVLQLPPRAPSESAVLPFSQSALAVQALTIEAAWLGSCAHTASWLHCQHSLLLWAAELLRRHSVLLQIAASMVHIGTDSSQLSLGYH